MSQKKNQWLSWKSVNCFIWQNPTYCRCVLFSVNLKMMLTTIMDCSSQMCLPAFEERKKGRKIHICVACLTILITHQENSKWFNILHDLLTRFYERLNYNLGNKRAIFLSLSCLKNLQLFCPYGYKTYVNLSLSWTTLIWKASVTYVSVCTRHHNRCRRSWHNVLKFR